MSVLSLGALVVMGGLMKVSVVTLLALRSPSYVSATIVLIAFRIFSFGKWCLWMIIMFDHSFQYIRIVFFFSGSHSCSFICHFKSSQIFLPHSNMLKYLINSSVTEDFSYSASFFAYFCLFIYFWTHYDSSSSIEHSSAMMPFD